MTTLATASYKYDSQNDKYTFNHLEVGVWNVFDQVPVAICDLQRNAWYGRKWKKEFGFLENGCWELSEVCE